MSQPAPRRSASVRRKRPVARVPLRLRLVVRGHLATCGDCEATAFNELRPAAVVPRGGPHLRPVAARRLARGRPGAAPPRLHPAALATCGGPRLRPVALATRGDSAGARASAPS